MLVQEFGVETFANAGAVMTQQTTLFLTIPACANNNAVTAYRRRKPLGGIMDHG